MIKFENNRPLGGPGLVRPGDTAWPDPKGARPMGTKVAQIPSPQIYAGTTYPLPDSVKEHVQKIFPDSDLSKIRIVYGIPPAIMMLRGSLQSLLHIPIATPEAMTVDHTIYVASSTLMQPGGHFDPTTPLGWSNFVHEINHDIQANVVGGAVPFVASYLTHAAWLVHKHKDPHADNLFEADSGQLEKEARHFFENGEVGVYPYVLSNGLQGVGYVPYRTTSSSPTPSLHGPGAGGTQTGSRGGQTPNKGATPPTGATSESPSVRAPWGDVDRPPSPGSSGGTPRTAPSTTPGTAPSTTPGTAPSTPAGGKDDHKAEEKADHKAEEKAAKERVKADCNESHVCSKEHPCDVWCTGGADYLPGDEIGGLGTGSHPLGEVSRTPPSLGPEGGPLWDPVPWGDDTGGRAVSSPTGVGNDPVGGPLWDPAPWGGDTGGRAVSPPAGLGNDPVGGPLWDPVPWGDDGGGRAGVQPPSLGDKVGPRAFG